MGVGYSRERRRGGLRPQRGRARVCEFRVNELVALKSSGAGVYQIIEAEEGRVKLCNINDPQLAAWFDVEHVEPYSVSVADNVPPSRGVSSAKGPRVLSDTRPYKSSSGDKIF